MSQIEDKKQAILDATLKLVSENGFHGTAMSKVAKEAGVSAGIIYHYFENKDELIIELYKNFKKEIAHLMTETLDESQPLTLQLKNICEVSFLYHLKNPLITTFLQQFMMSPYYGMDIELEGRKELDSILELFECGKKEMIIKDFPVYVFGSFIGDVASSLARKQCVGLFVLTDEMVHDVFEAVWQAIKR